MFPRPLLLPKTFVASNVNGHVDPPMKRNGANDDVKTFDSSNANGRDDPPTKLNGTYDSKTFVASNAIGRVDPPMKRNGTYHSETFVLSGSTHSLRPISVSERLAARELAGKYGQGFFTIHKKWRELCT